MERFNEAMRPLAFDTMGAIVFGVLMALKVNTVFAVSAGIIVSVGVVVYQLVRRRPVQVLQWVSLALVAVSGAAALYTHDARFVMAKPSLLYAIIGIVMLRRGWMLRYMPDDIRDLATDVTIGFGYAWAAFMLLTAAANLVVAINWPDWWPAFIFIVPTIFKFALFGLQFIVTRNTVRRRMVKAGATV